MDENFNQDWTNLCKSIVKIVASKLYPLSICQAWPTGLYMRWELDSVSSKFELHQNKTRKFKNMVISYFQRGKPQCKVESFYMTGARKNMMHTVLMAFVDTATLCLKPWDALIVIVTSGSSSFSH